MGHEGTNHSEYHLNHVFFYHDTFLGACGPCAYGNFIGAVLCDEYWCNQDGCLIVVYLGTVYGVDVSGAVEWWDSMGYAIIGLFLLGILFGIPLGVAFTMAIILKPIKHTLEESTAINKQVLTVMAEPQPIQEYSKQEIPTQ